MGKIRVKTFDEAQVDKDKKRQTRREAKKQAKKKVHVSGMGGGERTVMVGPTEEELLSGQPQTPESSEEGKKSKKAKFAKQKIKSKRYQENQTKINRNTLYPLREAVELLKSLKTSNFDETVELHMNVKEKGINGQTVLPHGTGKKLKIAVADDALLAKVEKGQIDFDVLVAAPAMMPKLAKVARILGPKGLMPNPKNGTISQNPDEVIKKLSAGQITYKTEAAAPLIHVSVGKISFDEKKLEENIQTFISAVGVTKINSVTLKSTMSPAIKIDIS